MRDALIEAMARAINSEAWEDDGNWCKTFQFAHRRAALDRATVALDAALSILETPSGEMIEAFGDQIHWDGGSPCVESWQAMLNTLKALA